MVYPRVGGGTRQRHEQAMPAQGLSPRGRGNLGAYRLHTAPSGSIPAWAGEPAAVTRPLAQTRVYPRVGGGTAIGGRDVSRLFGLSPRGRGNPRLAAHSPVGRRSIPAWAGEPHSWIPVATHMRVYPRVGGGTVFSPEGAIAAAGLSPRGRGNPRHQRGAPVPDGSIPAWAGEPGADQDEMGGVAVYPRVGGGTIEAGMGRCGVAGLSPRGRGNPSPQTSTLRPRGSIPAWAGEPYSFSPPVAAYPVYPRVGGGTARRAAAVPPGGGLSPRGRGNPYSCGSRSSPRGSIPAWAGEPPLSSHPLRFR